MIFSIIYIVACLVSSEISFSIWFMFGAILLDLVIDCPTIEVICKNKK